MKLSTTLLATSLLIISAAPAVFAGNEMQNSRFERLVSSLGLSDEQAGKLQPIMDKHHQQMRERRDQRQAEHRGNRAEMDAMQQQHRADLLTVLSETQLAQMEQNRPPHRGKCRPKGKVNDRMVQHPAGQCKDF